MTPQLRLLEIERHKAQGKPGLPRVFPFGWRRAVDGHQVRAVLPVPPRLPPTAPEMPWLPAPPVVPALPDPAPGRPEPPSSPEPGSRDYTQLPQGPYDSRAALPWDPYVYPEVPPPPRLPLSQRLERKAAEWYMRWWRGLPDEDGALPELPPGEERPLLPARGISRAPGMAGAMGLTRADVPDANVWSDLTNSKALTMREHIKKWSRTLVGQSPLDQLDLYLDACGIRHFSARELTRHKWSDERAKDKLHPPYANRQYVGKELEGAAWSYVLDLLGAEMFPDGPLFVIPTHIVPMPEMWPRLIPALRILDRFREWLGQPVRGISGYRHLAYNTMIKGSEDSFHMSASAIDFTYRLKDDQGFIDVTVFLDFFNHLFRAQGDGVGLYKNFIHLDVGHKRHLIPRKEGKKKKSQQWNYRGVPSPRLPARFRYKK